MKIYSSLIINWTECDTVVAAIKALTFFSEDISTGVSERALSALVNIFIVNETSDNAFVTYSWGSAKKHDREKGVRKVKSLGISGLVCYESPANGLSRASSKRLTNRFNSFF